MIKKIGLFLLFLTFCVSAHATQQVIVGQSLNGFSTSATFYCSATGISTCRSSETDDVRSYWPTGGTISIFSVLVADTAGTGKSYTITLMQNGTPTLATCTISGNSVKGCSDLVDKITVSPTDLIDIKITPSGTPASAGFLKFASVFTPITAGITVIAGGDATSYTGSNTFMSVVGGNIPSSATESGKKTLWGSAGTISNLYVIAQTAPGSTKTRTFTFNKNTSGQTVTCSMANTTTCSDTTHSFAVAAGDYLDIAYTATASSTGSTVVFGFTFTPANIGDFLFNGITGANSLDTSSTSYLTLNNSNNFLTSSGNESNQLSLIPLNFTMKALYVSLGTTPGGSATREITVRDNKLNTSLDITIANPNTTGNIFSIVNPVVGDLVGVQVLDANSPTASTFQYSILCNNPYISNINGASKITGNSLI